MRRHMFLVAGVAMAAIMTFSFLHVRGGTALPVRDLSFAVGPHRGDEADAARGREGKREKVDRPRRQPPLMMLFRIALSERALQDSETQRLLDKVIADREAMIDAQKARLEAYEKLAKAARSGDQQAIQAAKADVKAKTEELRRRGKTLGEAVKALAKQLKGLFPDMNWKERMRGKESRGRRRPPVDADEDAPPAIE